MNYKIIEKFVNENPIDDRLKGRIARPKFTYIGEDVLNKAISAFLSGKNILLVGSKSTGKNVLAENLSQIFKRPMWNVSFHVNIDSQVLIGSDTLANGNVVFRDGDLIEIHPATRFIATMNYNYEGTRELNEALLSRFVIIDMPTISSKDLNKLLTDNYSKLKLEIKDQLGKLFFDIKTKANAGEISDNAIDLRGIFDSLDLVKAGLGLDEAFDMCLVNKVFDSYEKALIRDVIKARFRENLSKGDVFEDNDF